MPEQRGTGGRVNLLGISKRGDTYLRTLLIHGARSVLTHAKEPGPWLEQIKARRPANVVIVAQAAKMARTIWAVTRPGSRITNGATRAPGRKRLELVAEHQPKQRERVCEPLKAIEAARREVM